MAKQPPTTAPVAPACTMVIFGARGDLAKRLLVPALYNLAAARQLNDRFSVLGVDHGVCDDDGFRDGLGAFLQEIAHSNRSEFGRAKISKKAWAWLSDRIHYQIGDFDDDETYHALAQRLETLGGEGGGSVLFYLATAPRFFGDIIERLDKAGLTRAPPGPSKGAFRRVVIEKPFGHDLTSAKALNRRILKHLEERQIYRIDHFLGKETVRNIMVTRFGNGVFEPLWNRLHIDSIEITAAETVTVEDRGAFYDKTGALRDMVPNHLFQLLSMIAMEPPNSFDPEAVRAEQGRAIEAIHHLSTAQALRASVRGQYGAGNAGGREVAAYRDSPNVDPDSRTETYVALRLAIDNWRWAGVPFYLRTGKALAARDTEIAIRFKAAPKTLFQDQAHGHSTPNVLLLRIQPNEGISLLFDAKRPGPEVCLSEVRMDFSYADWFQHKPATGYETLIYDCLTGDQTLFKRAEDQERAWAAVMPFLHAWEDGGEVHVYAAGTDGPAAARALLAEDGRHWRSLTE